MTWKIIIWIGALLICIASSTVSGNYIQHGYGDYLYNWFMLLSSMIGAMFAIHKIGKEMSPNHE